MSDVQASAIRDMVVAFIVMIVWMNMFANILRYRAARRQMELDAQLAMARLKRDEASDGIPLRPVEQK